MRRKRGARRLKIRTDDINKTNIHTYFKSEEAPLCRIEFQLITTSHGNGISPKLSKNLHKVRQVGTLPAAKTSSVGKAATFPEREGSDLYRRQSRHLPRKGRHFRRVGTLFAVSIPLFRFKNRGGCFLPRRQKNESDKLSDSFFIGRYFDLCLSYLSR